MPLVNPVPNVLYSNNYRAENRNGAIVRALESAEKEFEESFGMSRAIKWNVTVSDPTTTVCLQAVDYYLWALQRFYETRTNEKTGEVLREDRYMKMLWPQFATVHDLHFGKLAAGTTFTPVKPLTIETRFPPPKKVKKKMP